MSRIALQEALKKPGRVMTWHAGGRSRSHKTSNRDEYISVLPRELAPLLFDAGSTTTVAEFLELFLDELLYQRICDEAPDVLNGESPNDLALILLEIRGFFDRWMEFYVREVTPVRRVTYAESFERKPAQWVILANMNARTETRCFEDFEMLLEAAEKVAASYDLKFDMHSARNGFRSVLRRRMEAAETPKDWAMLDDIPFN